MRKMAEFVAINDIKPIDGADKIVAYKVNNWWVVDQKGRYQLGEQVVYLAIDSWVPEELAPFLTKGTAKEYRGVKGNRLRTIKLKGQISQGLLLPLGFSDAISSAYLGDGDLETNLNIQKWEPPVPACLQGAAGGNFPAEWRKTDQTRIQAFNDAEVEALVELAYEVSIKLDGSSCSVGLTNDLTYTVASRNLSLKTDAHANTYVAVCNAYGLKDKLEAYGKPIQISGELVGSGIQGNKEKIDGHDFYVYDIYDPVTARYLPSLERKDICNQLGLKHVPVLHVDIRPRRDLGLVRAEHLLKYAEGPSMFADEREGLVFKSSDGQTSWKAISNRWLLSGNE